MFENATNNQLKKEIPPTVKTAPAVHAAVNISSHTRVKKDGIIPFAEQFIKFYRLILIVTIVVLIIVCSGGIWLIYEGTIRKVETKVADNQALLAEKEQSLSKLKSVKVSVENLEESAQKILAVLPAEKDLPNVFVQLEALAFKNNLFLRTVDIASPEEGVTDEGEGKRLKLNKLVITLNVAGGDYFTLKNFLADIEKNLRLLDIKALSYLPQNNSYNLVINTYYFGEQYEKSGSE